MIKAIFFDLDGTIRLNEPRGTDVFTEHAARLGLRVREDDLLRAMRWEHYYWANSHELKDDVKELGRLSDEHWLRYAHRQLVALGASAKEAAELAPQINDYMLAAYEPRSVVPQELPAILEALTQAGIQLGVISNRERPLQEVLTDIGLIKHFPYSLASGEIQAWKPDPQVFLHACKAVGVEPAESVYVGDNWFADVVGAKAAGLTPVLYDPRGIFDDPECAVITAFDELPPALGLEAALLNHRKAKASDR
jgi:HAD superfamily hydrolase (TIGR01662 family)